MEKQNINDILEFASHWAKEMMANGANAERVSFGLEVLLKKYKFEEISISVLNTMISLSVKDEKGEYYFRQLAVPKASINLERVKRLNRLSYRVRANDIPSKELMSLLDEALESKIYPKYINFAALLLAMISLCRIFGGCITDILVVILNTTILFFLTEAINKTRFNRIISNVLCMFICTGIAAFFYAIKFSPNFFIIILTNAFYLVPGIQMINAFENILCGHEQNGIIELLKSLLEVLTIIAGVALGFFCFCQNQGLLIEGAVPARSGIGNIANEIELVVLSVVASLSFGVVFEIHGKDLLFAALGGGLIRIFFIGLLYLIPTYRIAYMTLAAFFAALYAEILAITQKKPSTLYRYPALIPIIPGDLILYTFFGVVWQNYELFSAYGLESVLALVGICTGFVLCSTIMHYVRRIVFRHKFK